MWVRKKIEISAGDLIWGMAQCALPTNEERVMQEICDLWESESLLICLSVRSGFDLLLTTLDLDPKSEIIMSGLTIPDMAKIVQEHQLNPVAVDVDPIRLAPDPQEIRSKITSKTRAIVIAHLWGGLCDMDEIADIAREHDLLLIEDCAQAYVGNEFTGDPRADVSMFSFGSIKTNTALGGGVLRVSNAKLLGKLRDGQADWDRQSRFSFFSRLAKYCMVRAISTRPVAFAVRRGFRAFGTNHDHTAATMARGFAGPNFFDRIRHQPSKPLLRLLCKKLKQFDTQTIVKRQSRGSWLADQVMEMVQPPQVVGRDMIRQTYWVFALLVDDPQSLVQALWDAGFDATNRCSLGYISEFESKGSDKTAGLHCKLLERHIVFLPLDISMPQSEVERMMDVIRQVNPKPPGDQRASTVVASEQQDEIVMHQDRVM